MSGTFCTLLVLAVCLSAVHGIGTYIGDDGKTRYETPLLCNYQSLYYNLFYNVQRSLFTKRYDSDCCYLESSRNKCCVEPVTEDGTQTLECRCDPSISCGDEPLVETTQTVSTSTTTATTAPETTTTTPEPTTTQEPTTTTTPEPTTTQEPTTTTTPEPTTTTTPEPTTTQEPTTTTTPEPTTTQEPTTTTTPEPTTTAAETTTTTTAAPRSLCSQQRLIQGVSINDCAYAGVANITAVRGVYQVCNAVYVKALVNGEIKNTFLTEMRCQEVVKFNTVNTFDLHFGIQVLPIVEPLFTLVDGLNGSAFFDLNERYASVLTNSGCEVPACAYDRNTMAGMIDFNDCKVVSHGKSIEDGKPIDIGYNEVPIVFNSTGCNDADDSIDDLCFTSVSGENIFCYGDIGAPVYCKAFDNGESILIGVIESEDLCNVSPDVLVIPVPN